MFLHHTAETTSQEEEDARCDLTSCHYSCTVELLTHWWPMARLLYSMLRDTSFSVFIFLCAVWRVLWLFVLPTFSISSYLYKFYCFGCDLPLLLRMQMLWWLGPYCCCTQTLEESPAWRCDPGIRHPKFKTLSYRMPLVPSCAVALHYCLPRTFSMLVFYLKATLSPFGCFQWFLYIGTLTEISWEHNPRWAFPLRTLMRK